jgi:hypothetical protein
MWARGAGFKLTQPSFPGAAQHEAKRNDALLTRDRNKRRAQSDPGSAVHRCALHRVRETSTRSNLPGRGNVSSIMRAVRARNTTF